MQHALGEDEEEARQVAVDGRCESISAFVVQLQRLLQGHHKKKFILVFDNIDRQREAAPTLLPALARLHETVHLLPFAQKKSLHAHAKAPFQLQKQHIQLINPPQIPTLTTIFIITTPRPSLFQTPGLPHIHFPPYTRSELISLVSATPLPLPATDPTSLSTLWTRFATLTHDTLLRPASTPTLPALLTLCARLWPAFTAPIRSGHHTAREFPKLLLRNRPLFQSEDALRDTIITIPTPSSLLLLPQLSQAGGKTGYNHPLGGSSGGGVGGASSSLRLPLLPAQLLVAAYLASHTAAKHDTLLFSKHSQRRRRRRRHRTTTTTATATAGRKNRKISRSMLVGAQTWGLERMLAIHAAVFCADEDDDDDDGKRRRRRGGRGGEGETLTQVATLVGMRLVVRAGGGGGDALAGDAKWRVNIDAGVARAVGRGVGCEVEEWVVE